jgi:tetratricopeptide (TPR) repeat protein
VTTKTFSLERSQKILSVINEELRETERLSRQQNFRNPETLFRIAELNLEKARIVRDEENEKFLSLTIDQRRTASKDKYFKKSKDLYVSANLFAQKIVKEFPRFRLIDEVYFVLGSNYKELGDHENAKKYFNLSLKNSSTNSKIQRQAMLSVADYAYNDKDFSKAKSLYEQSLKSTESKWWTKDAFNLAWSYFRLQKYDQAINTMLKVHSLSKDKRYVNMQALAERDIGMFYVDAKRIDEAILFYEKNKLDYSTQFLKIAENLISQGRFTQAERLLSDVYRKEKKRDTKISFLLSQLMLYDKFDKLDQHYEVSATLVDLNDEKKIPNDEFKKVNYFVDKKSAELQKQVTSKIYKDVPKVRYNKANYANKYFELSARLNPESRAEKSFYQGETWYSIDEHSKALNSYIKSFDYCRKENDEIWKKRSLEGMLSSLEALKSVKGSENYLIEVYTRFLRTDSKSDRANNINLRLFNTYYSKGEISAAEASMRNFSINFPSDFQTLEGMLAKIMEYHRSKKNYSVLLAYVKKIENKDYKVSSKYESALKSLVTKIQIEEVQKDLESGNKTDALKGYLKIYANSESTQNAKANAAYNLAVLYHELGDSRNTLLWTQRALSLMQVGDIKNLGNSFVGISSALFLRHEFNSSSEISANLFSKLCNENNKNKEIAFKNSVYIYISQKNLDRALELRKEGLKCHVPDEVIRDVSIEILKELSSSSLWETYEEILIYLKNNQKNYPLLIAPYEVLKTEYLRLGDQRKAMEIDEIQHKMYSVAKSQNLSIPVETLDLISRKILNNVEKRKNILFQTKLEFPEEKFNILVKDKLKKLEEITSDVDKIKSLGSGIGVVEGYIYLIESYQHVANELNNFVPPDKSSDYIASFKNAMNSVSNPLKATSNKLLKDIKDVVLNNKILSPLNSKFMLHDNATFAGDFINLSPVLMERKGKR